ncbi:DNA-binding protein [Sugarcane bacilliform Guadeloupe A virus]|uniref:DNA-binding protein n=1 Tax=Sugarcane bacilliform Guadeloupe A virus TaxID=1960252 RepID=F2Q6K5_9VIRU|nr:DNA-binding protein [Sugarcane bacilliform Guadeloupe A virus]ACZ02407.1 DNA-binding protein [Sugarcane bacilliform Guadeloupe A virus]
MSNSATSSSVYQQAITNTTGDWESPGIVISGKGSVSNTQLTRQLNTAIFLCIKVQQEVLALKDTVADIQNRVKTIEGKSGSTSTGSFQLKSEIDSISDKLTKIQQIQKTQPKKDSGTLATSKVFQDPYNILRNLK